MVKAATSASPPTSESTVPTGKLGMAAGRVYRWIAERPPRTPKSSFTIRAGRSRSVTNSRGLTTWTP